MMISCPASMVNFIWFTDKKKFIASALSNMRAWNQASHNPKIRPSRKQVVLVHSLAGRCTSTAIPRSVWKWLVREFLWPQWQNFNSLSLVNQIKFIIEAGQLFSNCQHRLQQDYVCTHGTLWRQHYITASKEYLTNRHILSKYSKLEFLRLLMVKISCKLIIIWVNYIGRFFYEIPCICG